MTTNRVLAVDDEAELREMISDFLGQQGYQVVTAENGEVMRRILDEQTFDLVLLDKNMPGEDGFSLARYAREHHDVGIIMLTASADLIDKVVGLEIGADDYITKPFDLRELLARIKSVLRRKSVIAPRPSSGGSNHEPISVGRCLFDPVKHELFDEDGSSVPITSMEFDLIQAFVNSPNRVLSRDFLLDIASRQNNDPFDRSIDTRISRLRRKIEADPAKPTAIKTVRNVGYMFVTDSVTKR